MRTSFQAEVTANVQVAGDKLRNRRLPQRRHRVLDRRTISTLALSRRLHCAGPNRCASPECAHRMLAMPTRRRAQLVEDAPLLRPFGRPVTFHHRRQHFAPRAHADLSRHRGHRTNLVALLHSSARSCPVTFWVRQCDDWVKKAEIDSGRRTGVPTEMAEKLKALERENRELRQANEILRKASAYFAMAELDRRSKP